MKKAIRTLIALLCIASNFASAEIIETKSIHELRHYINPESLILLDIDNTLMEPVQTLGSDQWFYHQKEQYIKQGMSQSDALEKALAEWMSVQSVTKVQVVEEGTAELVDALQREGYIVMGLTTRGLGLSTRTIFQLKSLDINLSVTAPTHEEVFFINNHGVLFRGGILFTAGSHKGMALSKFLHLIDHKPESVVFINDKRQNIEEVEVICEKYNIPFIGLRYSWTDEKVENFDADVARHQFEHFGQIISDEEAVKALQCAAQ